MALMVFIQNVHVLNCRSEIKSAFKISFKNNPLVIFIIIISILLQIVVMEVPLLSQFLQTTSIPFMDLIYLLIISFSILLIMEVYKYLKRSEK